MFHFEAIKLISENLRDSVAEAKSGQPGSGREGMALGQYVAGMGFSNVGLGIDHAMAHTLSAHYDTPHGVACAMLLPIAMEFNKPVCAERLAKVAVAMGVDTTGMSTDEAADAAIAAVKQLSADVNIPHVCEAMKADEIEVLAKDAMADACFPGNPREATLDDVIELFKDLPGCLTWFGGPLPVSPTIVLGHVGSPRCALRAAGASSVLREDCGANGQGPAGSLSWRAQF